MGKYGFFFGAGAEENYGIPLGSAYTLDSMLNKKDAMYAALKNFYSVRTKFCTPYRSEFLFRHGSHTLFEMFISTAIRNKTKLPKDLNTVVSQIEFLRNIDRLEDAQSEELKNLESRIKDILYDKESGISLYEQIISDHTHIKDTYRIIINDFSYFGAVEKDFSCIIDPNAEGTSRFWRLINYFWSCYFTILLPILYRSKKYGGNNTGFSDNPYSYVLNHLGEVIEDIYSPEFYTEYEFKKSDAINYYKVIRENLDPLCIFTTNYTPMAKLAFGDKVSYLAGELQMFENPSTLTIQQLDKHKHDDFIFPYMLTQAPVKPIIEPYQLRQYGNMLKYLGEIETLVVIGYSFCRNDNHINAIIRDYILTRNGNLLYCKYLGDGEVFEPEVTKKEIQLALRLDNTNAIKVLPITGNSSALISALISNF